jgi:conjugative transfer region protein TrbK
MRGSFFTIPNICRAAGLILVAGMTAATVIHGRHEAARPATPLGISNTQGDPLSRELERCLSIGLAAENDANCAAAWAENRHRFFIDQPQATDAPTLAPPPNAASATR